MTRSPGFALLGLALLLAGGNVLQNRTEFAAPQSRWPSTLPGTAAVEAKPDRVTGYTGLYPAPDTAATPR